MKIKKEDGVKIPEHTEDIDLYAPQNHTEKSFYYHALSQGLIPVKTGWTDFLVLDPKTGDFTVVEVKGPTDHLKRNQKFILKKLAEKGIKTYVWTVEDYRKLVASLGRRSKKLDSLREYQKG